MGIFSDHLKKNINLVLKEVNYKITYTAYQLFYYAVVKSPHEGQGPYVSGHFINNWFVGVNKFDTSTTSDIEPDGKGSMERIEAMLKSNTAFFKKDGFVTLSNNLNYAARVESLGWPKGYDPATGWNWTGKRVVYAPVAHAMLWIKDKI
jgi:hypothetical protein